ncbi:MAG TPA: tyrosine-type recombinase/integrase [Pseudolabrys sp.]|jgi:integrase|nr:tyrosine-type recombinase/integrase [Pseudolabrys sp.]
MSTATPRILLTDAAVRREPFALDKPRIVRDSKVAGLHVWIGKRKKTFRYQYETPRLNGARGHTLIEWLGEHPHHSADDARAKALAIQAARVRGEYVRPIVEAAPAQLTFGEAFEQYKAAITKEGKSPRTIADYQDKFNRHLVAWHKKALAAITRNEVSRQHTSITERARKVRKGKYASGKYAANGAMRLARAVWNFAKNELETPGLPGLNPFRSGKLYHREQARESGMGAKELPAWWAQLQKLPNPIRREMHLFMLLTGLRRQDVLTARWDNLDENRRSLRIPAPKGGVERAFDLPLSEPMLACLKRAKEAGNTFFPEQSQIWVFPAETGHVAEVKEDGKVKLSHTGHALRHSFRTLAGAAGIDRLRLKILMNHAVERDVTDSYANVPALFDSLMDAQRRISAFIMRGLIGEASAEEEPRA